MINSSIHDIVDNFDKNINDIVDGITDKAQGFANSASESADIANEKAIAASVSETNADTYAKKSQSYAVGTGGEIRDGDDTDCAEYYYNQIRKISQGIGGVIPMGTITYEELNRSGNQKQGYLFNISDSFVSDERFRDGGGLFYGAGSNVLYTTDNMWDVLAASMVSGVKGASENEYRQGFVSLSAKDVGAAEKSDIPTKLSQLNNDRGLIYSINPLYNDGYVPRGFGVHNKVWGTDASVNPGWRDYTPINSLSATMPGSPLDAVQGKY